jgi:hypothetical protein
MIKDLEEGIEGGISDGNLHLGCRKLCCAEMNVARFVVSSWVKATV